MTRKKIEFIRGHCNINSGIMSGNNNNMNMKNIKGDENTNIEVAAKVSHPCVHCGSPCFGSQCKACHLKMVAERQGDCVDCKKKFNQLRKDGTRRKRCEPCQEVYSKKHISKCGDCNKPYHASLPDGRTFAKCYDCYQKNDLKKCKKCDFKIQIKFDVCGKCLVEEKTKAVEKKEKEFPLKDCRTKSCKNKTTFTFCRECHTASRDTENQYMISTCQEAGCGYRSRGNFKFCKEHYRKA